MHQTILKMLTSSVIDEVAFCHTACGVAISVYPVFETTYVVCVVVYIIGGWD